MKVVKNMIVDERRRKGKKWGDMVLEKERSNRLRKRKKGMMRRKRRRIKEMESLKGRCFRSSRDLSFVLDAENTATITRGEGEVGRSRLGQ